MKASELSIGDWVKVLNYYWDGSPYIGQVDGIMKKHGTYYLRFGDALSTEIDMCVPIPLTPEILEKNGFNGGLDRIHHCHIKYVHQLQHALRLAGVEKDVVV
jgi:hypothetical protein